MCCFSRSVSKVSDTNIFARSSKDGGQFLVYSMILSAKEDLAMILPIPVPKHSKADAVRFINLEKYADFFKDLLAGFPRSDDADAGSADLDRGNKLKVERVGSFDASFVPAIKDFKRLDERFRLPAGVWDKLPAYKDYGFAVFKLRKGAAQVHPMALEFPRADPKQLFFPTVHIHDGKVHPKAHFDHALYCQQGEDENLPLLKWEESTQPAGLFMKVDKTKGLLAKDGHCYLLRLGGNLENKDTVI
ncbi:MAG TPA: hypothetical protein VG013_22695 [Gemmataceae bacterium]|jgi:hypothetical protein|nr:hypothetical protein [Gemmataceae bacterium]